jgi:hypothetical protein
MNRGIWTRWFAATSAARSGRASATSDETLGQQIDEIERALRREDPALLKRVRRLQRRDTMSALTVFALLAGGAVLVTAGLATTTAAVLGIGVAAMLTAGVIDHCYRRALRRPPGESKTP